MKQLLFAGLVILTLAFTGPKIFVLSGTSEGNTAHLTWNFTDVATVSYYTVQRAENAGNLKNYWATVATVPGTQTSVDVVLKNGKNTFRVAAVEAITGKGYLSNELNLK